MWSLFFSAKKPTPTPQSSSRPATQLSSQPATQPSGPARTRKKTLVMEVPAYNKDPATQARNIRNFYQTLLKNYTDYALEDVSKKVCSFLLISYVPLLYMSWYCTSNNACLDIVQAIRHTMIVQAVILAIIHSFTSIYTCQYCMYSIMVESCPMNSTHNIQHSKINDFQF